MAFLFDVSACNRVSNIFSKLLERFPIRFLQISIFLSVKNWIRKIIKMINVKLKVKS